MTYVCLHIVQEVVEEVQELLVPTKVVEYLTVDDEHPEKNNFSK